MITIPQVLAQSLGSFLAAETRGRFGSSHGHLADFLPYVARLTMECIGNSDALYHDIEHSMLVALVGHDILMGRLLLRSTTPRDYANFILACLTHDIGYVRGVVQGDGDGAYVADVNGRTVKLPIGSSDAALAPYHVDRSKLFVIERFDSVEFVDADRIARAIEYTRFPYPSPSNEVLDDLYEEEGLLLRAADLIGQLGDPNYMRKANALFYEFEEIGLSARRWATRRRPTWSTNTRSSTGRTSRRRFRPRSAISTSPPAAGNGSPISIATCSAPSAS